MATSTAAPAACRGSQLGARRRKIWEGPATPPRAACSCSAAERGAGWSARPPCLSSASSPRAGGEEGEEQELWEEEGEQEQEQEQEGEQEQEQACLHPSGLGRAMNARIEDEASEGPRLHLVASWLWFRVWQRLRRDRRAASSLLVAI